jgi:sulfate permease, SulP family
MATRDLPAWTRTVFPIVAQLESYRSAWLLKDVSAGLAIAAVALPIGVAYPAIAGLPPIVGLYASILPLIDYAIFGSSRQLIVGPDAATLTILAASLAQISSSSPEPQGVLVSAVFAITVGVMCLLSGACRLGFIANFLSRPNSDRISLRDLSYAADRSDKPADDAAGRNQGIASTADRA